MAQDPGQFLPADLPHQGPMRWVHEAALSQDAATVTAHAQVAPGHPFVRDGILLPAALLEFMAQAAAAGSSLKAKASGRRVSRGVLVALREFTVVQPIRVASPLTLEIVARHEKTFGSLSQAWIEVRVEGSLAAAARMTFHLELV
jgi:predicted hotdog family 3-hydroxylacyl-ACP dehydratase